MLKLRDLNAKITTNSTVLCNLHLLKKNKIKTIHPSGLYQKKKNLRHQRWDVDTHCSSIYYDDLVCVWPLSFFWSMNSTSPWKVCQSFVENVSISMSPCRVWLYGIEAAKRKASFTFRPMMVLLLLQMRLRLAWTAASATEWRGTGRGRGKTFSTESPMNQSGAVVGT